MSPRSIPTVTAIRTDLTMPTADQRKPVRGAKNLYNFDALPVGGTIGVIDRTAKQLSTTISTANKKEYPALDKNGKPVMEVVKDSAGQPVNDPSGKPTTKVKTESRVFFVVDADPAKDPEKATARIWREA